ncbi:MAG: hypothetical protein IJS54_07010 [Desulfovibrio sp.]|nr:hypothetical protein [Desulfovibrio sp.]
MTKSQRSGIKKLQLAKLFRWLAVLCCIKLALFLMILLDFPFPAFHTKAPDPSPILQKASTQTKEPESAPQKPMRESTKEQAVVRPILPEEPVPAKSQAELARSVDDPIDPVLQTPAWPLPAPLPAPIAEPGTVAVYAEEKPRLPVPTLGAVTAAHAAASMPVPQNVLQTQSLTPYEQQAPIQRRDQMPVPLVPERAQSAGSVAPIPRVQRNPVSNQEAQDIARQQQDMLVLKKQMDERIKELQDSEAKVKRMLLEAKGVEAQKIKTLIQMFGNMKPKTAARALEKMDEGTACRILEGLTPKQSGDILSYTNPAVTAKLTEQLSHMKMK